MQIPIFVPLLNPNEPEANVVSLHVVEGQFVQKGDLLATFETTKSASDLYAEYEGYISGLKLRQGDVGRAGEIFCYSADSPDWKPPEEVLKPSSDHNGPSQPSAGLRITKPAEKLAHNYGVDISRLPADKLITEQVVRQALQQSERLL